MTARVAGGVMHRRAFIANGLLLPLTARVTIAAAAGPSGGYGLSLFGELKYGPGFQHFDYVKPDAPKGGLMRFAAIGTYDTLNPFIIKGVPAAGIGQVFETLMTQSLDEPGSEYGLVAESAVVAPDRLSVLYTLRAAARFSDGSPITPADVVWTFDTLRAKGHPMYRSYYADVTKVMPNGERGV